MSAYNRRELVHVVFVRHGLSEGNAASKDDSIRTNEFDAEHSYHYRLMRVGQEQAARTGVWIKSKFPDGFDAYFCSPYARTQETAALLDIPDAKWRLESGLEESSDHIHDRYDTDVEDDDDTQGLRDIKKETYKLHNYQRFIKGMQHVEMFLLEYIYNNITNSRSMLIVCHANVLRYIQFRMEHLCVETLKDTHLIVRNCEVFWFNKTNLKSGHSLLPPLTWYRMTFWCDKDKDKDHTQTWEYIEPTTFSNEELLRRIEQSSPYLSKH